ncbi:glycosyltransferase family 4 protein [Psychroflexus salinarum]|uniref:Glycosyltransferase family 4 protein n=1 Tax=Psychroflexus salinarum TaxID=546024 RepID=A0ABW3GN05_9FLAO
MKILFLTMVQITSLNDRGIYQDLINELIDRGHKISVVSPLERRLNKPTAFKKESKFNMLNVKTLNLTKSSIIEKGVGQMMVESQYLRAIKKHFRGIQFDLVLYSTPPITFTNLIKYIKKRDNAYAYLLLKDIFPQNAVDMGFIKSKSLLHKYFEKKEKRLYKLSDKIGCMSNANKAYILKHNPEINASIVEVNPNSIKPVFIDYSESEKKAIRKKYNIPLDKIVFVYGGNLGVPQGIDFLIETISNLQESEAYFLIVGSGTQYHKLKTWFSKNNPKQATLLSGLPKDEYDKLVAACDIGMIFLDNRFTIPNFPSRLLSYLEMKKPVLAATDINTDIGKTIEEAKCGFWIEAGNLEGIQQNIKKMCNEDLNAMGEKCWELLERDFLVQYSCQLIEDKVNV